MAGGASAFNVGSTSFSATHLSQPQPLRLRIHPLQHGLGKFLQVFSIILAKRARVRLIVAVLSASGDSALWILP